MAIQFELYKTPRPKDEEGKEMYHARVVNFQHIDTDYLAKEIQIATSLTEGDVKSVLESLSHFMGDRLREGQSVHLDGIGYFYPTLTATEEISADTPRKNSKVKLKAIQFRSDKRLKRSVGTIKIKQMKRVRHSAKLSEIEIDMRLKEYFVDHQIMQRSDFQGITGMVRSTAMIHIRRLRKEGKLLNIGIPNQPIYVPAPGFYGKSRDYQPVR